MDRLQRLRLRTQEPRPKTATATATAPAPAPAPTMARTRLRPRDGVQRPQPTGKTRRKHRIARGQKVVCGQNALCSKQMVIRCRTQEDYTCQLSLLILLHTRSYATLCPIRQNDSERTIEYDYRTVPKTRYCFILLEDLGQELNNEHTIAAQLPYLEALEESLIGALHVLHSHNISFPVSTKGVKLVQQRGFAWGDLSVARLFLPYNENASWASGKLAPTWKADQLASARSIFFIPKVLCTQPALSCPISVPLTASKSSYSLDLLSRQNLLCSTLQANRPLPRT
ncbi:hypothetical protein F5Y01DRAFT_192129 [Xylaria sp. FL0043]|nr:hypothetical protein F5Y01DRAFT_192129 [Xylaria sp. FL0043]